jgi:hypothetical protein
MNKSKFSFWVWLLIEWMVAVGLVYWLVGGSWWLALFLGSAMANIAESYRRIRWNRQLFDVSDAELVRVSAIANSLQEETIELRSRLTEIKIKLDELEARATR